MSDFNTSELKRAFDFAEHTNRNIFLTGKAGTGKTTFLHHFKKASSKRMIVVAPTGVAAINAGGMTIHSFFQMPFGPHFPKEALLQRSSQTVKKMSRRKKEIMQKLDLLVIDEISMVRADLLDGIDEVLRKYKNHLLPFGGVQLLMIGDLQQLPPIVPNDEWELLKDYYDTLFFFGSRTLRQTGYISIELTHVFRQNDDAFIQLLNQIRDNTLDDETLEILNQKYQPDFCASENDGYIILTTHNKQAKSINTAKLDTITQEEYASEADVSGDFPQHAFPTDSNLILKKGAQVMFVKNDPSNDKLYYNGKIGKVVKITDKNIYVKCSEDLEDIEVKKQEWSNINYSIDPETGEIKETVNGTFTQYPLKLAWAITIHKSQGLTFEKAIIDASSAFAHGQVYVALSRCKSLDGIILISPISRKSIKHDPGVLYFMNQIESTAPDNRMLTTAKYAYQLSLVKQLFDFNPIRQNMNDLITRLKKHKKSVPQALTDLFVESNHLLRDEVIDVTQKFEKHIDFLTKENNNIEENIRLQERIKKGCQYFIEKLDIVIVSRLENLYLDIKNENVRKIITNDLLRLDRNISSKLRHLRACSNGFTVEGYLSA